MGGRVAAASATPTLHRIDAGGDLLADVGRAQLQLGPWLQTALDVRAYLEDELNAGDVACAYFT